jgi:sulfate-transporting ATPase
MADFVYTMQNVRKVYPGKEVIKDLTLAFLPGAKIGILGLNGAGKSTLLKIMGGLDTEYTGEAKPGKNVKVGYLAQEPKLDANKSVRENVEGAVAATRALLTRFEELSMKLGEALSDAEMEKVMNEHGRVQDEIEAKNAWDARQASWSRPWTRCAARPPTHRSTTLSGGEKRRVALCKPALWSARSPAARRAHQPSRRRKCAVAGAVPGRLPGHGRSP